MAGQLTDDRAVGVREPERGVAVERQARRLVRDEWWRRRRGLLPGCRCGEDLAGQVLRLLDVRLVEGVDPEDRSGDRGCDFPAIHLRAQVDRVGERDPDDGMPGIRGRIGEYVARRLLVRRRARAVGRGHGEADEDAVRAVRRHVADRLPVDRNDAGAVLARALRQELLEP